MEEVIIRHTELLEMDPETKSEFRKIARTFKYKVDLYREMKEANCEVSRVTLNKLLKGYGNNVSIEKVKSFIQSHTASHAA